MDNAIKRENNRIDEIINQRIPLFIRVGIFLTFVVVVMTFISAFHIDLKYSVIGLICNIENEKTTYSRNIKVHVLLDTSKGHEFERGELIEIRTIHYNVTGEVYQYDTNSVPHTLIVFVDQEPCVGEEVLLTYKFNVGEFFFSHSKQ